MRIIELEQNSDAWLQWRHTGLGSSDAPSILGVSPWKDRKDLWEEKVYNFHRGKTVLTGRQLEIIMQKMVAKEAQNESAKNRGKKLEPEARELYEEAIGIKVPSVCGIHAVHDFLKVSLDGWEPSRKLFTEIKAPNQGAHMEALNQKVPHYYVPQLLHQFLTSGAKEGHYVSYSPKFPPGQRIAIVPINPYNVRKTMGLQAELQDQIDFMEQELCRFWKCIVDAQYKELGED